MTIDLNKGEEYGVRDFTVFNEGKAGIVNVTEIKVEKKKPGDKESAPDYRLVARDDLGEINEGFYYQVDTPTGTAVENFKKFQSQRLIWLGRGVFGETFKFPLFDTPKQALDEVMKAVSEATKGKHAKVAVCYGTKVRPQRYLRFKSFNRFIELNGTYPTSLLLLESNDLMVRPAAVPTDEKSLLKEGVDPEPTEEESDWLK